MDIDRVDALMADASISLQWLSLPDEIWISIMLQLRVADIIALEQTCLPLYLLAQDESVKLRIRLRIMSLFFNLHKRWYGADPRVFLFIAIGNDGCASVGWNDTGIKNDGNVSVGWTDIASSESRITLQFADSFIPWLMHEDNSVCGHLSVANNPSITPEFVTQNPNGIGKGKWDWSARGMSSNRSITPAFVLGNLDKPWEYGSEGLSSNPFITLDIVRSNLRLDDKALSANQSLCLDWILAVPQRNWSPDNFGLSRNPSFSPEYVIANEFLRQLPGWVYGFGGWSGNRSVTMKFVTENFDHDWDLSHDGLSANPALTLDFLEEHINTRKICCKRDECTHYYRSCGSTWEWGYAGLSNNQAVTPLWIERHLEKPWEWNKTGLSQLHSLTPEFVIKYRTKLDLVVVLANFWARIRNTVHWQHFLRYDVPKHLADRLSSSITPEYVRRADRMFRVLAIDQGYLSLNRSTAAVQPRK